MVDPNHFNTTHKLDAVQLKPVRMQPLHSKGQSKRPTAGGGGRTAPGGGPLTPGHTYVNAFFVCAASNAKSASDR